MAQGTALVMIVPNVLLAFYRYRQHHTIPLEPGAGAGRHCHAGLYPAARLAVAGPSHPAMVFIGFGLGCALTCAGWWHAHPGARAPQPRVLSARYLPVVGWSVGYFSGLFTVGGGLVATPMLVRGFGHRQAAAQAGAGAGGAGSLIALSAYASAGRSAGRWACPWRWAGSPPFPGRGLRPPSAGTLAAQRVHRFFAGDHGANVAG